MPPRERAVVVGIVAAVLLAGCSAPVGSGTAAPPTEPPTSTTGTETPAPTSTLTPSRTPSPTATPTPAGLAERPPGVNADGTIGDIDALMEANRAQLRDHPFVLTFSGYQRTDTGNLSFRIRVVQGPDQRFVSVIQGNETARKWERGRTAAIRDFGEDKFVYEDSSIDLSGSASLEFEQYYHPQFIRDYFDIGAFTSAGTTTDAGRTVTVLTADGVDPTYNGTAPSDLAVTARVTPVGIVTYFDVDATFENRTVRFTHRVSEPESPVSTPAWLDRNVSRLNATPGPEERYLVVEHRGGPSLEEAKLAVFSNDEFDQLNTSAGPVANGSTVATGDTLYIVVNRVGNGSAASYRVRTGINERPAPPPNGTPVEPRQVAVLLDTDDQQLFLAPALGPNR